MFMINILHNIFNGPEKTEPLESKCRTHNNKILGEQRNIFNKRSRNGTDDIKIKQNKKISVESPSNYIEYCEKTMLVADSGHHTKPTIYPIEIKSKKCSSSNLRSISPSQSVISVKKATTISLNKLPPISSFFSKNISSKDDLFLQSATTSSSSSSSKLVTLSPSYKSKFENEDTTPAQKGTNKAATLIIPTFRSEHQPQISSTSSIVKQHSNELLRRLTQPNTIPPTTAHRIPNRDSASNDSLNLEMCYFKPIKAVPITPSKKGSPDIKRPLPKRIKPKRRKCDVFIGPKKGQMPILFSTLTAFRRCSAFYTNKETTALELSSEIPELDLYPLCGNTNTNKKNAKERQRFNNLPLKKVKESKNKFYIRNCYVIVKRNNLGICFKSKNKKGNNIQKQSIRIKNKFNSSKNIQLEKEEPEKNVSEQIIEFQPSSNKRFVGRKNKNVFNNLMKSVNDISALEKRGMKVGLVNRKKNENKMLIPESVEEILENNIQSKRKKITKRSATLKNISTIQLEDKDLSAVKSIPVAHLNKNIDSAIGEQSLPKRNTRSSNNKAQNSTITSKVNNFISDEQIIISNFGNLKDKKANCQKITNFPRRNTRNSVLKNNFVNTEVLPPVVVVKTKAAVKELVTGNISSLFNSFGVQRLIRKRSHRELNVNAINECCTIENTNKKNKKLKIEKKIQTVSQRATRQQRQSTKETDDLLKSDYEFALKLQMELELEVFPVEPVANRTRRLKSHMNISCDESDNSSSVVVMNQQQYLPPQQLQTQNNNLDNNSNSNESNLSKMLYNKNKTETEINIIEEQSGKFSKIGRKSLKNEGENPKFSKRLFSPLKDYTK